MLSSLAPLWFSTEDLWVESGHANMFLSLEVCKSLLQALYEAYIHTTMLCYNKYEHFLRAE